MPNGLITFLTSLEGSGPLIATGMAGKSEGSMSAPTGFTLVVDLPAEPGVGVVADVVIIDPDIEGEGSGVVVDEAADVIAAIVVDAVATDAADVLFMVSGGASLIMSARSRCTATFWGSLWESG